MRAFHDCQLELAADEVPDPNALKRWLEVDGKRFTWKLASCHDLTYNEGPGGEHQMDIEGGGARPPGPSCCATTH